MTWMDPATVTQIAAFVGMGTGIIGASLGIVNTLAARNREMVRLKVIPQVFRASPTMMLKYAEADAIMAGDRCLCIEVVNAGSVPCTVDEVGLTIRRNNKTRYVWIQHGILVNGRMDVRLPQKLEPKSSITVYSDPFRDDESMSKVEAAYAKTSCDMTFKGTSGALKAFVRFRKQGIA